MRDIKFRAWDEQNKIMHLEVESIRSGTDGDDWILFKSDKQKLEHGNVLDNPYFQQQIKVMQYTGLKDKNGKEIYEGDIVIFRKGYVEDCWTDTIQGKYGIVKFYENNGYGAVAEFVLNNFGGLGYLLPEGEHFEVVGNIYENPELLRILNETK